MCPYKKFIYRKCNTKGRLAKVYRTAKRSERVKKICNCKHIKFSDEEDSNESEIVEINNIQGNKTFKIDLEINGKTIR